MNGQLSPHTIVTITSADRSISSVHALGVGFEMSIPFSAITATATGSIESAGPDPAERTSRSERPKQAGGHLGPAGVAHAQEEDTGLGHLPSLRRADEREVADDGQDRVGPYTDLVKRLSPIIILGAIAAFLIIRRRDGEVVIPDSAWNPVDPS